MSTSMLPMSPHRPFGHAHVHHGRGHGHVPASFGTAFAVGIGLNLAFVAVEFSYGVLANSVALMADAGHNLSDVLGLVIAWIASVLTKTGRLQGDHRGECQKQQSGHLLTLTTAHIWRCGLEVGFSYIDWVRSPRGPSRSENAISS